MSEEIFYTSSTSICCKGEDGVGSHPLVYYSLSEESPDTICEYCGAKFRYDKNADSKTHHP